MKVVRPRLNRELVARRRVDDCSRFAPGESDLNLSPCVLVIVLMSALPIPATFAKDRAENGSPKVLQNGSPKGDQNAPSKGAVETKRNDTNAHDGYVAPTEPHLPTPSDRSPKPSDTIDTASPGKERGTDRKGEHGKSPIEEASKGSRASKGDTETKAKAATDRESGEHTGPAPIDTRIPEQPQPPLKLPDKITPKEKIAKPANVPPLNSAVARNAIGAVLTNEPTALLRQGPVLVPGSATGAAGAGTGTVNGSRAGATVGGYPKGQQGTGLATGTPAAINPAVVNGTGLGRLGSGPAIVRGTAKPVAQINGATIRAKH